MSTPWPAHSLSFPEWIPTSSNPHFPSPYGFLNCNTFFRVLFYILAVPQAKILENFLAKKVWENRLFVPCFLENMGSFL